jgi:hypothetical protein
MIRIRSIYVAMRSILSSRSIHTEMAELGNRGQDKLVLAALDEREKEEKQLQTKWRQ